MTSWLEVSAWIAERLKNQVTVVEKRVYELAHEAAYLILKGKKFPAVGVVFLGGKPMPAQGIRQTRHFNFRIPVFQSVWKHEKVVTGDDSNKGIGELVELVDVALDGQESPSEGLIMLSVTSYLRAKQIVEYNGPGYHALAGLEIKTIVQL